MKLAGGSPARPSKNREFATFRLPLLSLGADHAGQFRFHQRLREVVPGALREAAKEQRRAHQDPWWTYKKLAARSWISSGRAGAGLSNNPISLDRFGEYSHPNSQHIA